MARYTIVQEIRTMSQIILDGFNLESAQRRLVSEALSTAGNIVGAARLLGITRHSMKRRIVKLRVEWPRRASQPVTAQIELAAAAAI
jgi:transcriptional regulator with GAF, ATPase, and Fis domain